jgi:8-oxo-dGTP pyrophosphatase MutT (NUDIX family)
VLPGGGIGEYESLVQGLKREIIEETNYRLFNPLYFFGFSFAFKSGPKEMFFFYEDYVEKGGIECNEGQEMRFKNRKDYQKLERPWYLDIVLNHFSKNFNSFK